MKRPIFFLILILAINLAGMYYQLYLNYSWFDQVLHFSGGFFVAMLFSIYLKNHLRSGEKLKNILIILSTVAFMGVAWEFSEYIASLTLINPIYSHFHIRTYFIGDLEDTLNDLLMGILGACFFAGFILHPFWRRKTHQV